MAPRFPNIAGLVNSRVTALRHTGAIDLVSLAANNIASTLFLEGYPFRARLVEFLAICVVVSNIFICLDTTDGSVA
jgi:hypothetical protein